MAPVMVHLHGPACALAEGAGRAGGAEGRGILFYESKIRPLLIEQCHSCHSNEAAGKKKLKAGLRVDSLAAMVAGGDSGPSVVSGKPEESLLIKAVRYTDSDLKMPPRTKLSEAQILLLEQWVKMGAPAPPPVPPPAPDDEADAGTAKPQAGIDLETGRKHWAYQPLVDAPLPRVRDEAWIASDIDRFILAKLESAKLAGAARADARTLIRRATFDLTGLPPTAEEIEAFVKEWEKESSGFRVQSSELKDKGEERHGGTEARRHEGGEGKREVGAGQSEVPTTGNSELGTRNLPPRNSYARLIDRLLASPRYGERWGRHWLDVVRYADSNGLDENVAHGNAWRYRDYVIDSFNRDKPFNRFIIEQIAGDLLIDVASSATAASTVAAAGEDVVPSPRRIEQLTATGFLAMGPKVLAEVDKMKMEMDIIDEQMDTLGRAFLAQTIGCARCHDHKFDPISASDYYALAGIFKSTTTMADFKTVAKWWEHPTPTAEELRAKREHGAKVETLKKRIAAAVKAANEALLARLGAEAKLPAKPEERYEADEKAAIRKLRDELAQVEKTAPVISSVMGVTTGKPTDLAIHIRGSHQSLGAMIPRRFPQVFGESSVSIPVGSGGRLELARWIASDDHPLTARVIVNRVWRWHFGAGLSRSVDNFGKLGEAPTHQELLDWLALRFIEDGWSIKKLHRRIMLSSTYQMSSDHRADAALVDPENRLWSRAPVRRLEAEAIRDAVLFVSGRLDGTMGGPAITHVKNREFLFDHTSRDGTRYDSLRRSVYLPVIRNHLYDFFELFDFPDSAVVQGDRPTTTVAPQALLAMNNPLIWESAGKLAAVIASDDDEALVALHEKLLGRPPRKAELDRLRRFMDESQRVKDGDPLDDRRAARLRAAQMLVQAMMISSEFIYVR